MTPDRGFDECGPNDGWQGYDDQGGSRIDGATPVQKGDWSIPDHLPLERETLSMLLYRLLRVVSSNRRVKLLQLK
jgi:hypothetical protein